MKVLYVSYDGMTDSLGQSQVLPYLKELKSKGCDFHIISLEKHSRFKENENIIRQICSTHKIEWHPQVYEAKIPIVSPFKNFKKLKKKAKSLHKEESFDIVHCRSDIPALIGRYLQRKHNVKFLFDMRGFWADERVEGGLWNISNPIFSLLYRFFKNKEASFFKESDAIVSLTKKGKHIIEKMPQLNGCSLDITVIPCCVDLDLFDRKKVDPSKVEELKESNGINKSAKVFGYLGSIGTWYMLDEMLAFYAVQRKKLDKTCFLFVTGEDPSHILSKATALRIPEKEIIVMRAPHSLIPNYISLFDISLFFIRPTFSKSASSPTKQGELMAMGVPIICNAGVGDTDEIIFKYKAGNVLRKLDQASYETVEIDKISFDTQLSRKGAEEWFSLEKGAESYLQIYQRMLSK